jgi:hypothetical protein
MHFVLNPVDREGAETGAAGLARTRTAEERCHRATADAVAAAEADHQAAFAAELAATESELAALRSGPAPRPAPHNELPLVRSGDALKLQSWICNNCAASENSVDDPICAEETCCMPRGHDFVEIAKLEPHEPHYSLGQRPMAVGYDLRMTLHRAVRTEEIGCDHVRHWLAASRVESSKPNESLGEPKVLTEADDEYWER